MKTFIGFAQALDLTLASVGSGGTAKRPLREAAGQALAEDLYALVDSPSVSTSRKDGYAVCPEDVKAATPSAPVRLKLVDRLSAGEMRAVRMNRGETVRVTTGALIPEGASAVISEEFCRAAGESVFCLNTADPGRNILPSGTDVHAGEPVASSGDELTPALLGLIAAAGHGAVRVHTVPRAAVIATGDEVLPPGQPLEPGKLYASNMVEIGAWLALHGIPFEAAVVADRPQAIREAVRGRIAATDIFITSGGAWGSEKDLILKVAADMGWTGIYHRVRMGPGKPVGFGLLDGKPFFVLPGGPPSNEMAFLQLCLPALRKMMGLRPAAFPFVPARLSHRVTGERGWTEFIHARLEKTPDGLLAVPSRLKSRLRSMAEKEALIVIPEDRDEIPAGELIEVQALKPTVDPCGAAS
jgi:molybdopterin molybdotransferase